MLLSTSRHRRGNPTGVLPRAPSAAMLLSISSSFFESLEPRKGSFSIAIMEIGARQPYRVLDALAPYPWAIKFTLESSSKRLALDFVWLVTFGKSFRRKRRAIFAWLVSVSCKERAEIRMRGVYAPVEVVAFEAPAGVPIESTKIDAGMTIVHEARSFRRFHDPTTSDWSWALDMGRNRERRVRAGVVVVRPHHGHVPSRASRSDCSFLIKLSQPIGCSFRKYPVMTWVFFRQQGQRRSRIPSARLNMPKASAIERPT